MWIESSTYGLRNCWIHHHHHQQHQQQQQQLLLLLESFCHSQLMMLMQKTSNQSGWVSKFGSDIYYKQTYIHMVMIDLSVLLCLCCSSCCNKKARSARLQKDKTQVAGQLETQHFYSGFTCVMMIDDGFLATLTYFLLLPPDKI